MKKIALYILAGLAFTLNACMPEQTPELQDPFVQAEQVIGTWKLAKVEQMDASPMGDHPEMYDLTEAFAFSDVKVEFKENGAFAADFGSAPALFKTSDTYAFLGEDLKVNKENPYFIDLVGGSTLALKSVAFNTGQLKVKVEGACGSSAAYHLTFTKQ